MATLAKSINAKKIKTSLIKAIEKKLPFEVKEETFQNIAAQVLERAKKISDEIKKNPVSAVKNIKQFLGPLEFSVQTSKTETGKKTKAKAKKPAKKTITKKNVH